MAGAGTARKKASPPPGPALEPFRDRHALADGFARTENHLLMPLGEGPEVIDRRERQALDVHAATDLADPYRYSLKMTSASSIDWMAKRRWRSSDAPGNPFVYQPRFLRNSMAVVRESPWNRSAYRACSSAVLERSV